MAKFRITTPDGATYDVTAPEGVTQDEVLARVKAQHASEPMPAPAAADKAPTKGSLEQLGEAVADVPREIGHQFQEARRANAAEIAKPYDPRGEDLNLPFIGTPRARAIAGNTLAEASAPVTGALTSLFGRPIERLTQGVVPREAVGNTLSLVSGLGEAAGLGKEAVALAKEAGLGEEEAQAIISTRRATQKARMAPPAAKGGKAAVAASLSPEEAAHAARVDYLQKRGVELTPGQERGGMVRRIEEAAKSNPYVGQAVRDAEGRSITSFNRAAYNEALAPIGEKVTAKELPDVDVGRSGVGLTERKIGAAYDRLLPKLKFVPDDEFRSDVAELQAKASILPSDKKAQLRAIIQDRVMRNMKAGTLDGKTFKLVESDLSRLTGALRGAQDPWDRQMGDMLEDLQGSMRSQLERSSDPAVRKDLQNANKAWAIFTRVRTAAANRVLSGGKFTPGDLLAGVKRGDRSAGKGAFARGDALLQEFADVAGQVLPNKLPDSGTAERLMMSGHGLIGAGLGGAVAGIPGAVAGAGVDMLAGGLTNKFVEGVLRNRASRFISHDKAVAPTGPNYLARATLGATGGAGATNLARDQTQ